MNTIKFINKLKNKYPDYTSYYEINSEYINMLSKINIIIDNIIIETKPKYLINGSYYNSIKKPRINNTTSFISKSKSIYKELYSYNNTIYTNDKNNVIITCNKHGDFSQKPTNHLNNHIGCIQCKKYNKALNSYQYSDSKWCQIGNMSKNFTGFKLYILKCWNEEEEFYKIGKTFRDITKRYKSGLMPYKYKIINTFIHNDGLIISQKERQIKTLLIKHRYIPTLNFGGMYECFKNVEDAFTLLQ